MDDNHFDRLTRNLVATDSRRRLLGALAAFPAVGGVLSGIDAEIAEAKRKKKRKKKKKKCTPEPATKTCAGKCGKVTNNCRQAVSCTPCPIRCTTDTECAAGKFCNGSSQCVSTLPNAALCTRTRQCTSGFCTDGVCCDAACSGDCQACNLSGTVGSCTPDPAVCPATMCCSTAGTCQPGNADGACGSSGICDICLGQNHCQGQACRCVPECTGVQCGPDGCGGFCPPGCGVGEACVEGACQPQ